MIIHKKCCAGYCSGCSLRLIMRDGLEMVCVCVCVSHLWLSPFYERWPASSCSEARSLLSILIMKPHRRFARFLSR